MMARPNVTAPIAGTSKPEQLGDLVKAATLKLSPAQIEALLNQVVEHLNAVCKPAILHVFVCPRCQRMDETKTPAKASK